MSKAGGWLPFLLMLACSVMGLQDPFPSSFPYRGHAPHLSPQQKHPKACLASLLTPGTCWPSQGGTAALMLPPCWGKVLAFSNPLLPVVLTQLPQCSSRSPISPGPGWGANLAVSLHGCARCHLHGKSTIKMPYSHGPAVRAHGCFIFLTQLAAVRLVEVMGPKPQGESTAGLAHGSSHPHPLF